MKYPYLLLLTNLHYGLAAGQDTNYWTQQFGTRSALMGGAVVGGVKDNTAIFYNPGSLGFLDTGSVSVNANLYRFENISIENAQGQQKGFKSAGFTSFPVLAAAITRSSYHSIGALLGFTFNLR